MAWIHRTMILPAALVPLAQALAEGLAGPAGAGMWVTGLSADGSEPATHYVSTGMIEDQFAAALTDADALYAACQAAGASVTQEQCEALVAGADVSSDSPIDSFSRMGLQIVRGEVGE
jgi:hypothetical protein